MKRYFCFTGLLFSALVLCLPVLASAGDDTALKTSITEEGECGHENVGKLQFLKNSDQDNGYEVTLKAKVTQQGKIKESLDTQKVEAGGKKLLGCSFSDIMPLTSYNWSIISETKN
jgi:hypothetical protein